MTPAMDVRPAPEPRFWRRPLDLDLQVVPHGTVHVIEHRCKECSFCIEFCPRDILRMSHRANRKGYRVPEVIPGKTADCVACRHCEDVCPEFCIYIEEAKT